MKYQDLLKENKTLQRKIEELKIENKKNLELASNLTKSVIELKTEIIRLTRQKEQLARELEINQDPLSELIKISKNLDIF